VIGAGALGQTLGVHLASGGCEVEYVVKPGQAAPLRSGTTLYQLRPGRRPRPQTLRPDAVHEAPPAARSKPGWDMIWLCVQSPALAGEWTAAVRDAADGATIVSIGQQLDDLPTLASVWPEAQIVQVVPALFAYPISNGHQTPPGGAGVAFWVPPGSALRVAGPSERAKPVASALRAGRLRAGVTAGRGKGEMLAAANMPFFAAVGLAGGSLRAAWHMFPGASLAARQATQIVAASFGVKPPPRAVTSPHGARAALWLLGRMAPFDFAAYTAAHIPKISAQTAGAFGAWIREGRRRNLPVDALARFQATMTQLPPTREAR
jgi:hypothetical protein